MAVQGGSKDTLIPEAYPALLRSWCVDFPDWPELQGIMDVDAEMALARAIRTRQEAGMLLPYPSMISSLDQARLVMVRVRSEAEIIARQAHQAEDD